MSQPIHYQTALQKPLCYNGRTENVTYNLAEVTCRNCLDAKRREQLNKTVNWDNIKADVISKIPKVEKAVKEFCLAHAFKAETNFANHPPSITMAFHIPANDNDSGHHRANRKTVGFQVGSVMKPNNQQVYIPNEEELDIIATFVGELATTLELRVFRLYDTGLLPLIYELKAYYRPRK